MAFGDSPFACQLRLKLEQLFHRLDGYQFVGAPLGGLALANFLAFVCDGSYLFPEKKVLAVETRDAREQAKLVFSRHEPQQGSQVIIVEDVCNNFSTTGQLIDLVHAQGATVAGIACFLNRSPEVHQRFLYGGRNYPVFSLARELIPEYRQDDPLVAADIIAGNVFWKPKDHWDSLMREMKSPR